MIKSLSNRIVHMRVPGLLRTLMLIGLLWYLTNLANAQKTAPEPQKADRAPASAPAPAVPASDAAPSAVATN